jgi:hypothetical protein
MRLTLLSLALAIAAAVFLFFYPTFSGFSDNRPTQGQWALIPVALPVVVALVPVMFPHPVIRIIAAVVLGGARRVQHWPAPPARKWHRKYGALGNGGAWQK